MPEMLRYYYIIMKLLPPSNLASQNVELILVNPASFILKSSFMPDSLHWVPMLTEELSKQIG